MKSCSTRKTNYYSHRCTAVKVIPGGFATVWLSLADHLWWKYDEAGSNLGCCHYVVGGTAASLLHAFEDTNATSVVSCPCYQLDYRHWSHKQRRSRLSKSPGSKIQS